jgi:hypothetical protein
MGTRRITKGVTVRPSKDPKNGSMLRTSSAARQKWIKQGLRLADGDSDRRFKIGDWMTEGEEKWSRKAYTDASAIFTNYDRATLRNLANVARSVKTSLRNDVLSWSHHAAVARFAKAPETQKELLAYAARLNLPLRNFRRHIGKKYPAADPADKPASPGKLTLTLPAGMLATVEILAKAWKEPVASAACYLIERALEIPDIREDMQVPPAEAA